MADQKVTFYALVQRHRGEQDHVRCLFYPEVSILTEAGSGYKDELDRQVRHLLGELPTVHWFRRRSPEEPPLHERVVVTVPPPENDVRWRSDLELTFDAIRWQHGRELHLAYVPLLDIEVFGESEEELLTRIPDQILFALKRRGVMSSLGPLLEAEHIANLELQTLSLTLPHPTPKEIEQADDGDDTKSALKDLTTVWRIHNPKRAEPTFAREREVERLSEALIGTAPRSVLLVGSSGIGKTAIVREWIRQRAIDNQRSPRVRTTTGSRIVSGASGFGMWQERCRDLVHEADPKQTILHLGNLVEIMEAGRGGGSGQGIAGYLAPKIETGEIRVIVECTPEQKELAERRAPGLLEVFETIEIREPDGPTGRSILVDVADWTGRHGRLRSGDDLPIDLDAIDKLDRLHRRYATYSVYPGRPLRFLKSLLEDRQPETIVSPTDVVTAFSRETGIPASLLDEDVPLDLNALRETFENRVIGQTEAVTLLVDLFAAIKAGLTQVHQPIASLLFIGPTGVGKTEMAKAITEFFYGDARRMIRIDMSEYADPLAIERLIGGPGGEGVLTAAVREQPFGVVLFDEFEKAHPLCFDLLLQILGEGRLTDTRGQLADFRNCLIVMTSNLGVEEAGNRSLGFIDQTQSEEFLADHFTEEVRKNLRPELFNRIDRVIPFRSLGPNELRAVLERELKLVFARDGIRFRGVSLEISEGARDHLVAVGTDRRYGARPLKRAIERELLTPLSHRLNGYRSTTPIEAEAVVDEKDVFRVNVTAREPSGKAKERVGVDAQARSLRWIEEMTRLRRWIVRADASPTLVEFRNERYRLRVIRDRMAKRGKFFAEAARLAGLEEFLDAFDRLRTDVIELETEMLTETYRGESTLPPDLGEAVTLLREDRRAVVLRGYALATETTTKQTSHLMVFPTNKPSRAFFGELATAYEQAFANWDCDVVGQALYRDTATTRKLLKMSQSVTFPTVRAINEYCTRAGESLDSVIRFRTKPVESIGSLFNSDREADDDSDITGVMFTLRGELVAERISREVGLHTSLPKAYEQRVLVDVTSDLNTHCIPAHTFQSTHLDTLTRRRMYDLTERWLLDPVLHRRSTYDRGKLGEVLAKMIDGLFERIAAERFV